MTTLLFLFSLVSGWTAYNLYHPIHHRGVASVVSFLAGWLVGELALHVIAVQLFLVFLFAWAGAIEGLLGALALLVFVVSWAAMGYFYLTGRDARATVAGALQAGLGEGFLETIPQDVWMKFPKHPDARRLKLPFAGIDSRVEVIKDVPFGTHAQRLDIYRPRRQVQRRPVLLQIHGGAWTEKMGSKNEQAIPLMSHMAQRDWICVSVDYRLSPGATFPEHLIDCKEGLAWIRANIAEYGGNPDFVVVTGGSAGGHLCAMMALTQNDPQYQPGFENADTSVVAAVPFYGVMDFTRPFESDGAADLIEKSVMKRRRRDDLTLFEQASPLYLVSEDAPPFFVIQGDMDTLVPVDEARQFVSALRKVSRQPVVYAEIEGAQHAFDMFPSIRSEHVKHGVEKFLAWVHANYPAKG
ncbi:MAG: alpha/beta hydrolase fold domain-containing protein [Pseudomonadota bacterium]